MPCRVEISPGALRDLRKLPPRFQTTLLDRIDSLGDQPLPPGVEKISRSKHGYRIRLGDYRIIYLFLNDVAFIVEVAHRSEVYKDAIRKLNRAMRTRWKE